MPYKRDLKIRHDLASLGLEKILPGEIRVESLEHRLVPRVPFPHRHAFVQLLWVIQGSGWHDIDFHRHPVKPQSLFVMKPGQVHDWNFRAGIRGILIEFDAGSTEGFVKSFGTDLMSAALSSPDILHFSKREAQDFEKLVLLMRDEFAAKSPLYEIALATYLRGLLIFIARKAPKLSRTGADPDLARRFQALVDSHFRTDHRVEDYAKRLGLTAKALTMRLSRTFEKPPREIIQERLLLEAKRLLSLSELGIAEIGLELGIEDANYFSRLFRSKMGMTPSQFRNRSPI